MTTIYISRIDYETLERRGRCTLTAYSEPVGDASTEVALVLDGTPLVSLCPECCKPHPGAALDGLIDFRHTPDGMVRGGKYVNRDDVLAALAEPVQAEPVAKLTLAEIDALIQMANPDTKDSYLGRGYHDGRIQGDNMRKCENALEALDERLREMRNDLTEAIDAAAPQPAEPAKLPTMRQAFRTTTVEGGERQRYTMTFAFSSMEQMHAADDEWRAMARATQPTEPSTRPAPAPSHYLWDGEAITDADGVPVVDASDAPGDAAKEPEC